MWIMYTGCNLKTTKLLACAHIGLRAVILSDTVVIGVIMLCFCQSVNFSVCCIACCIACTTTFVSAFPPGVSV